MPQRDPEETGRNRAFTLRLHTIGGLTFFKWLKDDEDNSGIGAVGETFNRKAGKGHGAFDRPDDAGDVAHLTNHGRWNNFRVFRDRHLSGNAVARQLQQSFGSIQSAFIAIFPPPPMQGLGTIGGFRIQLEDRAGLGYQEVNRGTQEVLKRAAGTPELSNLFTSFTVNVPQLQADIDVEKAATFAGMIGVTVFGLFLTPIFYVLISNLGRNEPTPAKESGPAVKKPARWNNLLAEAAKKA